MLPIMRLLRLDVAQNEIPFCMRYPPQGFANLGTRLLIPFGNRVR